MFKGFPEFRSNVLYCPKQFFTTVIPHSPVNCIRLVSYMLRKTLGWVDETGEPLQERHEFSYRELEANAGVAQSRLGEALELAMGSHFIRCVQKARMQAQGVRARSAAYEICWDETRYTDTAEEFRGFYIAPTYLDSDNQTRLARKNIPNVFFDYLVRNENRGVIRVVGTLLWYSIDWGKGGERRKPVKKSLRDLVELTQLDKSSVVRALDEATEKGYIERVEPGVFDRTGKKLGSVTVYGIHWTNEYTYTYEGLPVESGSSPERSQNATRLELVNASKMRHGEEAGTLPKRDTGNQPERSQNATRNAPKTQHRERFQNATIRIPKSTISNTPIPDTTAEALPEARVVAALNEAGFSSKVTSSLAAKHPAEVILRQIELLPRRGATKNPLGLLRRAIEENWAPPQELPTSVVLNPVLNPASEFASHFYAGYHANEGAPVSEASAADTEIAHRFLTRLLELSPGSSEASAWGRDFGQLVRYHHRKNERAFPSLRVAVQQYGDDFFARLKDVKEAERKEALRQAREDHFARFEAQYESFVRGEMKRHEAENTAAYREFEKERAEDRRRLSRNQFQLNITSLLEKFDSEESRNEQFTFFLLNRREVGFYDFWEWDERLNPNRFREGAV